ncbi:cysteine--tRNA ligase [Microaceticoccus formicicus]|uniref:cysteine--tRNA ligase n=1 Tax=Microaceticoccus formicicus TaxID=3118105 RepID=UPI003CD042A8|nr:cysteine--tRNA ligase [Peptoniphilaceae bacterium AMB_02]
MKIYNTLTRKKEDFNTIEEGVARIYVCGPTVYNYIHIGNARPIVVFDTLRRYLLYKGYDVRFVSNFTDIDDKIINKAKDENVPFKEITEKYINAYLEDTKSLNIFEEHTIHPKATEFIPEMVKFVADLEEKNAAYNVDGNVYFDISKSKNYGMLSKKNIDELKAGARIEAGVEKRNPLDFALWKKRKEESEPAWESPWGMGRPGWHIECSVMAKSILGDTIDIHAGGEDLQFPHHENEIAQSETLTGKKFSNYWMHNGMINVDNRKMSKSLDNFFLVRDIAKKYDGEIMRLWLLSAHYRNPINFSEEVMEQTKNALERLYNAKEKLERLVEVANDGEDAAIVQAIDKSKIEFETAMDDDINTADAVASLFEIVRIINTEINETTPRAALQYAYDNFILLADVLGLLYRESEKSLDSRIEALIKERNEARASKNYARADEIRDMLKAEGIELKDTPAGVIWKKVD